MTTTSDLRLDAPLHHRMPLDHAGQREYHVEQLIRHHIDSGERWPITVVGEFRPDLTPAQIDERIGELCQLNEQAAHLALTGQQRAAECALDEYAAALCQFAQKPDDLYSLADAVQTSERPKLGVVR